MRTEIKLKYCKVSFNEHYEDNGGNIFLYSTIEFEWDSKADSLSLAFSILMDKQIEDNARKLFIPLLEAESKDIQLEDTWLMVQGYTIENKHLLTKLISIAKEAENSFDAMLTITKD